NPGFLDRLRVPGENDRGVRMLAAKRGKRGERVGRVLVRFGEEAGVREVQSLRDRRSLRGVINGEDGMHGVCAAAVLKPVRSRRGDSRFIAIDDEGGGGLRNTQRRARADETAGVAGENLPGPPGSR